MSLTIKSCTHSGFSGTGANVSVVTPAASVGDLLFIIASNDFYTLAGLSLVSVVPSASTTEITNFDADGGSGEPHTKAWWAPVTTAGAVTVTVSTSANQDEERALAVYIISGADTSNPVDDAANSGLGTTADITAPAVSPTTSTAMLFIHIQSDGAGKNTVYTPPGGLTLQYNDSDGTFMQDLGYSQQLSASGSTGTFVFTGDHTNNWVASTIAIKAASGGGSGNATAWLTA